MQYFKHILFLVLLLKPGNVYAAAEPQHDLFAHVSQAIQHSTALPNVLANLTTHYRGDYACKIKKDWRIRLPENYLDALVQPLFDGSAVAFVRNAELTIINNATAATRTWKLPQLNQINCLETLPDNRIVVGAENGSLHFLSIRNNTVITTSYPSTLPPITGIAYIESNTGEKELFLAADSCIIIDSNTLQTKDILPIVSAKSITRLSKSKIGFSGIATNDNSKRRRALWYDANPEKHHTESTIRLADCQSNNILIAQCGAKIALAHTHKSNSVSLWGIRLEKEFALYGKYPPSSACPYASLTSLGDVIAVNDGGTVHIVNEHAELVQTLPDDNIHRTFADGKNGLITIRPSRGLLCKKTVHITAWKPVTFQQQLVAQEKTKKEQPQEAKEEQRPQRQQPTGISHWATGQILGILASLCGSKEQ